MLEKQTVTLTVTVTGFVPSEPPRLAWYYRGRDRSGRARVATSWVPVPDPVLFERLQAAVRPGDRIQITVDTDWTANGLPQHLVDFAPIGATADVTAARAERAEP